MKSSPTKPHNQSLEAVHYLVPLLPTSKSQKRRISIIEGALRCYAKLGIEKTTFDQIAKEAKTSRPLLLHYYPNKEEIFLLCANYVRARFQSYAVQYLQKGNTTVEKFDLYIESCFEWLKDYPEDVTFWSLFYYSTRTNKKCLKMNIDLLLVGQKRIAALLELLHKERKIPKQDFFWNAKIIQTIITGALIQFSSENFSPKEQIFIRKKVKDLCHLSIGLKD